MLFFDPSDMFAPSLAWAHQRQLETLGSELAVRRRFRVCTARAVRGSSEGADRTPPGGATNMIALRLRRPARQTTSRRQRPGPAIHRRGALCPPLWGVERFSRRAGGGGLGDMAGG